MQTHYRQSMNFTWDSAHAADEAYKKLKDHILILRKQTDRAALSEDKLEKMEDYRKRFIEAIENDLQTPQAVAIMWEMLKSNIPSIDKLDMLYEMDQIFGLDLKNVVADEIPDEIKKLAELRQQKREEKKFEETDRLRKEIEEKGYSVKDTPDGFNIKKK